MASFGDFNRVNTNVTASSTQLSLNKINSELGDSRLKLSTGKRINSAEDDSAGYAIATKLNSRVVGLEQALQNVSDAKSMLDIVENAYTSIIDNLIKLKSLATQAANGTIAAGSDEMALIASQMEAIGDEINDLADKATFNGKDLIGSSENDTFSIQTGEGNSDTMDIGLSEISMKTLFNEYVGGQSFNKNFNDADLSDFNLAGSASLVDGSLDGTKMAYLQHYGGPAHNVYPANLMAGHGTYTIQAKTSGRISDIYLKLLAEDELNNNCIAINLMPNGSDNPGITMSGYGINESTGATFSVNEWVDIKVEVSSNTVELFVNDTSLISANSNNLPESGRFKIGAAYRAYFDNMAFEPENNVIEVNDNERLIIDEDTVTHSDMRNLMNNIDTALDNMNSKMNELGIDQRFLSSKEENLTQAITANSAAHSRIMDTDFAKEQSNSIRLQILQQTATAALSQANMGPQAVLGFLGQ
jgi:flagellin-like hook-associated protein FlgL